MRRAQPRKGRRRVDPASSEDLSDSVKRQASQRSSLSALTVVKRRSGRPLLARAG